MHAQFVDYLLRDVILKVQHVAALQVIAVGPAGAAVIDQLHRNPHNGSISLIGSSQDRADLQFLGSLGRVAISLCVLENRIRGTHREILQCGQPADNGIGHSYAPHLRGLIGEIAKRQYSQGSHRRLRGGRGHNRWSSGRCLRRAAVPQESNNHCDHHQGSGEACDHLPAMRFGWRLGRNPVSGFRLALQPLQIGAYITRVLVAEFAVFLKCLVDDGLKRNWQVRIHAHWRDRCALQNCIKDEPRGIATKGQEPGCHFVEHHSKRKKEVAASVQFLTADLLRRHIGYGAQSAARAREMFIAHGSRSRGCNRGSIGCIRNYFCQSEIENLGLTALGYEDVGRLDIAMHDAFGVSGVKPVGNLSRQLEHGVGAKRSSHDAVFECRPIEKLHCDERPSLVLTDLVNGADIWMVQAGGRARLATKALEYLGIASDVVRKELQGDKAPQFGIFGLVDHAHTAAAELFNDAVMGNSLADHGALSTYGCGGRVLAALRSMLGTDAFKVNE